MQNEAHSTPDCEEEPKTDKTDSAGFAGAFFPQSHNLRVMGGTFTSEVHIQQAVQIPREHFQWIGRGEIDLRREIRPDGEPYMVERYRYGNRVCRRYTANIRERSEKTVILYDGENAEEECRQYISRHTNLWHPNIMQIFGVSNLGGKHAVIAQDSLIPYNEYLARHRDSVILRVFLLALWTSEAEDIMNYLRGPQFLNWWIRHSTGRLCADLESYGIWMPVSFASPHEHLDWNGSIGESEALEVLSIPQFHGILGLLEFADARWFHFRDQQADIHMGAVVFNSPGTAEIQPLVQVAFSPRLDKHPWESSHVAMNNGWMRFDPEELYEDRICFYWECQNSAFSQWMSQANHIFKRLQITSSYEDYGFLDELLFTIRITKPHLEGLPPGYFFLCPVDQFVRAPNAFGWPQDPWFWSFDPTGKDRLTAEEAASHGFPAVRMETRIRVISWDASIYDALRKFHTAKGFDSDSQEVANDLGYPLYQLTSVEERLLAHAFGPSEEAEPFAHVDEEVSEPTGVEQIREIGDTPPNASSTLPVEAVDPAASAAAESDNKTFGLLNFFRNWETPEFGSLC